MDDFRDIMPSQDLLKQALEGTNIMEPYTPSAPQMNTYTSNQQYTSVPQNNMQTGVGQYYTSPQVAYTPTPQTQQYSQESQSRQETYLANLTKLGMSIFEELKTVNINLVKLNAT